MLSKKSKRISWVRDSHAFHHMIRASGQSEVWWDYSDVAKFHQYGWRCSTNEDSYSSSTLIGNWSEERCGARRAEAMLRPLPNQFSHCFETTYDCSFKKDDTRPNNSAPEKVSGRFLGPQPELRSPGDRFVPDTIYRVDFKIPEGKQESRPQSPSVKGNQNWEHWPEKFTTLN
ncbi:hypothetical protein DNTS_032838 [Danionella cerebrum]|uniref:Uncharacterized protein n=1 Tax=Danionella cerebrum TaxID=2873325 RepID=A0A553PUR5_9TELE|nr:hypothetical protein DNTS_032838 [Danionella translucida]